MIDLLNETEQVARLASLAEDFLEKTDIRFQHSSLRRRRGARLQVTQTIEEARHASKLKRIRRVEEFVVLSPRSLAQALASPDGAGLLTRDEINGLWKMVRKPARVDDLAAYFQSLFLQAMDRALEHPHGPLAAVPDLLRRLVRAFVLREAMLSTSTLRDRELRNPRWVKRK